MTFHIITLFPEAFGSYFKESIIGRAIERKKIKVKFYNPLDYAVAKSVRQNGWGHKQADGKPYGGGPGMVLMAEPILKAVEAAKMKILSSESKARNNIKIPNSKFKTIIFSPSGKKFTNNLGRAWVKEFDHLILICGRYEGVDARVKKILKADPSLRAGVNEISIGDYVLTGGELPAMVVLDAAARQIPGVLGKFESVEEARSVSSEVYTRPEVLIWKNKGYRVPKVLLSGNHAKIEKWRAK